MIVEERRESRVKSCDGSSAPVKAAFSRQQDLQTPDLIESEAVTQTRSKLVTWDGYFACGRSCDHSCCTSPMARYFSS